MHPPVTLTFRPKTRDIGLAKTRYGTPEESRYRLEVAEILRHFASLRESPWSQKGYPHVDRRSRQLLRQALRFETCAQEYVIIRCTDCQVPLVGPKRCEVRICERCARKFAKMIQSKMFDIMRELEPKDGKRLMMVTLTVKTRPLYQLDRSDIRQMFRWARKLINELWPKKSGCGAFAVSELGDSNNLHIHALVYGHYVPQKAISKRWLELTGNSYVIDIRILRNPKKAVNYLLKYVTKPKKTDDPMDLAYYLDLLIGVRRIHTFGIFYNRIRITSKAACPCPVCGGKLIIDISTPGPLVPVNALFWQEAHQSAKHEVN